MQGRKLSFFQRYIKHISVKKITIFNCCPGSSENDVSAMYNCPVYVCNSDRHKNIDGKIHFFSFPVVRHISNKRDEKFGLNFASVQAFSLHKAGPDQGKGTLGKCNLWIWEFTFAWWSVTVRENAHSRSWNVWKATCIELYGTETVDSAIKWGDLTFAWLQ